MTVKLRGADYKAFLVDPEVWGKGFWFDDCYVTVDGAEVGDDYDEASLGDEAKVTIAGGSFYTGSEINSTFYDYETVVRRWLKARTVTTVVLEVANERLEETRAALKALPGVKLLR